MQCKSSLPRPQEVERARITQVESVDVKVSLWLLRSQELPLEEFPPVSLFLHQLPPHSGQGDGGEKEREDEPGLPAHSVRLGTVAPGGTILPSLSLALSLIIANAPCIPRISPIPRNHTLLPELDDHKDKGRTIMQFFPISTPFPIEAASTIDPAPILTKSPILTG